MADKSASIHPVDDRIFVKRHVKEKSTGGLHVPEGTGEALRGAVVAVGPGMPTMTGARMALVVQGEKELERVLIGDGVIYSTQAAEEITIESGKFDVLHFRDVIAVLKVTDDDVEDDENS